MVWYLMYWDKDNNQRRYLFDSCFHSFKNMYTTEGQLPITYNVETDDPSTQNDLAVGNNHADFDLREPPLWEGSLKCPSLSSSAFV